MTIGDMIEILNDVPEGITLDEWMGMPFMVEIGQRVIEVEDYQLDIDGVKEPDEEDSDDDVVAFIISPEALPPLDDEEDGFFSSPIINLN